MANPQQMLKDLLISPETFVTTFLTIFVDLYGTEGFDWSPETIRMELEQDFGIKLPNLSLDRIMAGIYLVTSNGFYKSLPDFIELCNILSGSPSTMGEFDPADASEVAWGITEAMLLSPPNENDDEPFNPEVIGYISSVLADEGILVPPDILMLGIQNTELLKKVQYGYSDDPEMMSSIWGFEKEKTDDINDLVKSRLFALVRQMQTLPLQDGNTADIAKKMLGELENLRSKDSVI